MLSRGAAKKVTIYVNEDTRYHMDALWDAILRFLRHKHVAGATVLRPVAGFGAHELIHSPDQEIRSEHMPMRIEFIDSAEKVDELLPSLYDMVVDGLIEVQDTNVIKAAQKGRNPAPRSPHAEINGAAKLIRIYLGEGGQGEGRTSVRSDRQTPDDDGSRGRHRLPGDSGLRRERAHAQGKPFSAFKRQADHDLSR